MTDKEKTPQFGSVITRFHVQPLRWRHVALLFLPLILVILGLVGMGYRRAIYGYTNYGPVAARTWGQPWFQAALGLTLPLLLYALRRLHRAKFRFSVHKQGLTIRRPPGHKTRLRWEEITGLTITSTKSNFLGWNSTPRHKCILHPRRGKAIQLDSRFKHLPDLIQLLKKQIYPRLLPAYRTAFQQGQDLPFGALAISRQHLTYRDKQVPWTYIEGMTAQNGNLIVHLGSRKEIKVPARDIKNMELLVKFIKEEVRS